MTSFLQSKDWQDFQTKRGLATFRNQGDGWSYLAIKETGRGNQRLYLPYGPVCQNKTAFTEALADIKRLAKQEAVSFIRLDSPTGVSDKALQALGGRPVSYLQLQPADTQLIDLSLSTDELLAQMAQNSRNITRNYQNKGLHIRTSYDPKDIQILIDLLQSVAKRNQINLHAADYFHDQAAVFFPRQSAALYIAELEDQPIAAALVYDSDDTRIYAHAAADFQFRKLNAGTALVGQLILDAKAKGLQFVDLYGITTSSDPAHPWHGFTKFKQSFGGKAVSHTGTWDFVIKPLPYFAYQAYQKLRRRLRR